jgi:hypothetical protein
VGNLRSTPSSWEFLTPLALKGNAGCTCCSSSAGAGAHPARLAQCVCAKGVVCARAECTEAPALPKHASACRVVTCRSMPAPLVCVRGHPGHMLRVSTHVHTYVCVSVGVVEGVHMQLLGVGAGSDGSWCGAGSRVYARRDMHGRRKCSPLRENEKAWRAACAGRGCVCRVVRLPLGAAHSELDPPPARPQVRAHAPEWLPGRGARGLAMR